MQSRTLVVEVIDVSGKRYHKEVEGGCTMNLELLSLRVKDCGPLKDVKIAFTDGNGQARPVTVLGGANGSGKTTVLELIAALAELIQPHSLSPESHEIHAGHSKASAQEGVPEPCSRVLDRAGYAQLDLSVRGKRVSVVNGEIPTDTDLPEVFFTSEPEERNLSPMAGPLIYKSELRRLIGQQRNMPLEFPPSHLTDDTAGALTWPSVLYFPNFRVLSPVEGGQVHREEVRYEWVHRYETVRTFSGSLDSYLVWLDYAEPETFQRVIQFLNSLNFDGKTFGVHRKSLKAIVQLPNGETHHLEELSSGEQNLLIVLLELRRRLLPHSLVLVDEIENSLHPAFQHRMAQGLLAMQRGMPFQLIVTTHAPAFLDIFGTESARVLTEF